MSDLFGNHIVGFPMRRLVCCKSSLFDQNESKLHSAVSQHFIIGTLALLAFECVDTLFVGWVELPYAQSAVRGSSPGDV